MARSLAELDVAVVMIDGLDVAGQCVVVALVITNDGTKVPVGLWLGDTENKTVVTALLADLVARGLSTDQGILCVLDGAKALAAGVKKVFGDQATSSVAPCTSGAMWSATFRRSSVPASTSALPPSSATPMPPGSGQRPTTGDRARCRPSRRRRVVT